MLSLLYPSFVYLNQFKLKKVIIKKDEQIRFSDSADVTADFHAVAFDFHFHGVADLSI